MSTDEDIETVADSLDGDIVVVGTGDPGTVEERAGTDGQPRVVGAGDAGEVDDAVRDASVVVVAVDGPSDVAGVRAAGDTEGFVVAVVGGRGDERVDPSLLEAVRGAVDVTLLAWGTPAAVTAERAGGERTRPGAVDGALDFVRMIHEPGHINLDLADARTVLTDGSIGVLGGGTASFETDGTERAVRRAFETIPPTVDTGPGSDALVSVVGGPEMSIADAVAAVRALREEAGDLREVIWGVATDDALTNRVAVDIVVDDVTYRPPLSAGDPCRRCGATLATYTLGERTTLACEACGFADLSTSLGDRSDHGGRP